MNIADKIKTFDEMMPANLTQLEKLFKIELEDFKDKSSLVEILEPVCGGLRKILINEAEHILDLDPRIDGASQEELYLKNKKFYRYTAKCPKGKVLAKGYSVKEIAKELNITVPTVLSIIKRGDKLVNKKMGRPSKQIFITREELHEKQDRVLVTKNKERFYFIVTKNGKEVGKFKGVNSAAEFLNVSKATVLNYSENKYKNKDGYKVYKEKIK